MKAIKVNIHLRDRPDICLDFGGWVGLRKLDGLDVQISSVRKESVHLEIL